MAKLTVRYGTIVNPGVRSVAGQIVKVFGRQALSRWRTRRGSRLDAQQSHRQGRKAVAAGGRVVGAAERATSQRTARQGGLGTALAR